MRGLSEESRYFRFISTLTELTPKMLVRYTQIDYDRELALVAAIGRPTQRDADGADEAVIGVVRYLLNPDRETCEFAIAIADDWQGKRLGSTLMRAIIEAARNKGLKRIEGFVLGSNARDARPDDPPRLQGVDGSRRSVDEDRGHGAELIQPSR